MPESNDKKYEQAMNDVLAIYSQAEQEMLEKVAKRVAKGITTEGWNEQKLSDTQKLNKELSELMQKANKKGKKKIAVEVAKGYLKGKHVTYKETAEIIKSEGFKIGNGKVSGNTWGKAGYFTEKDDVIDFYAGLMTKSKKNKGKETEVINQYIKLGKTKKINLNYGDEDNGSDSSALFGTLKKDMMYLEAAKQLDTDASKYFFENLKGIESELLKIPGNKLYFSKETGKLVDSKNVDHNNLDKYVVKPYYYSKSDEIKKLFNETIKKFKYDTLQIESDNGYVGYDQTIVYNKKSLVSKEEAENVVEEAIENMSYEELLENAPIPMNLKQLVKATNGLIDNATSKILRNANDVYQKVMANGTTGLLSGVDTRIQATQKMLNEYAAKGITSFVDKSGRNWELSSYAEMCARTVSAHAALQGHIDRQLEVGEDLVKVSTIGTTCPICSRWQGVVLSISGKSPKYHSLDEAKASGLFHPNCKHTLGMFIPELDGEGKVEPSSVNPSSKEQQRYKLIEKQRANERKIRYWKKRKSLAITPEEQTKANNKIKYWQYTNLLHCEKNGLRRQYAREGVMKGYSNGPKGTTIGNISNEYSGGSLSDYENMFKDVLGTDPKPLFKMNLQFFASNDVKDYGKWLKDEIHSLDQLDIDKAQMKDSSNKNVTPTSLYKKYIGDNPSADWAEVSPFEKGTKEYKTGYAKWLKEQIEEIGVSYKVKPQYTEVHEDIPEEDKKLSATEIYKKYHNGKKPTEAYKEAGGEEWTGMKYSKWVETQKKELIKNGITKKVPFENATTQKTANIISQATKTIADAKDAVNKVKSDNSVQLDNESKAEMEAELQSLKFKFDKIKNNIKPESKIYKSYVEKIGKLEKLLDYKSELDSTITGAYTGSQAVKKAYQELLNATSPDEIDLASEKYKIAKEKHIEMVKKKAQNIYGTSDFSKEKQGLFDNMLKLKGDVDKADIYEHISNQYKMYEEVEKEKKDAIKQAAKLKKIQEAELKKQMDENGGLLPDDKVIEECTNQKLARGQRALKKKLENDMKQALKEMGLPDSEMREGRFGSCYFDIHDYYGEDEKQKAINNMKPWQAIGDYTSGSRPHNFAYKENESAKRYFNNARYTREQAQYIDTVLDKAFEVPSATMKEMCVVRHGNDEDGLIGLLGDDFDYENFSHDMFVNRLKELNQKTESGEIVILNETGYLSTSPFSNGGFTDKSVELRILCPSNTKGLYVDDFSYYDGEQEIILKRNQKFKFVKAYAEDIDSDEFRDMQYKISGSGTSYCTRTIIYLQAIPESD